MSKTALITGASGGIGYELLRHFAKDGYNLVITARNKEKLEEIKNEYEAKYNIKVKVIAKDLCDPAAPQDIFDEINSENIVIDALVNNAGFGGYGFYHQRPWEKDRDMIQVNITALAQLTKLFVKGMVDRKHGRILNLASIAAFQPGPLMSVYYATKAFVLSFSEALAEELRETGVTVTALCPGPVRTNFANAADFNHSRFFEGSYVAKADTVAEYGYKALMNGRRVAIHGIGNKLLVFIENFIPESMIVKAVRSMQEKREK